MHDAADKDLGLAVIERWTYAFLQGYERSKKKQPYTTTLYDIMVAPFAGNKNALGANVGIKEDTSQRKFKDIKVEEFFGERSMKQKMKKNGQQQQPTIVNINSIEEIASLPSSSPLWDTTTSRNLQYTNFDNNRSSFESSSSTPPDDSSALRQSSSTSPCFGGIGLLLLIVILTTIFEKHFLKKKKI
jgi:glycosylphosphatidylinositol transamidase (GPIT) subunit GPI8